MALAVNNSPWQASTKLNIIGIYQCHFWCHHVTLLHTLYIYLCCVTYPAQQLDVTMTHSEWASQFQPEDVQCPSTHGLARTPTNSLWWPVTLWPPGPHGIRKYHLVLQHFIRSLKIAFTNQHPCSSIVKPTMNDDMLFLYVDTREGVNFKVNWILTNASLIFGIAFFTFQRNFKKCVLQIYDYFECLTYLQYNLTGLLILQVCLLGFLKRCRELSYKLTRQAY